MTNKEIILFAAEELISKGNLNIIDKVFSSNYTAFADRKVFTGHDFIKKYSKQLQTALPDIKVIKIEILSEDKNKITWLRVLEGTHKKSLKRIPPSNKKIRWEEMVVSHFENKKILTEYLVSDLAGKLLLSIPNNH